MVVLPATLVASAVLLPLAYLVLRTAEAGPNALALLWHIRTFELLVRTTGLALAVTTTAVAIAMPLAWLTVHTDLPARRVWAVLVVLPLVIPSYVGAFAYVAALGPRGMLQQALSGPFGVERLPEIYGLPGAWLVLTLFTYPYVLLTLRAALQGLDPALEEAARSLGFSRWAAFWRVTLAQLRPALTAGGLLVALYTLSDFGVVSMLQFDSFTRAIYVQYQAALDRTLAAALALLLVLLTLALQVVEVRTRGRARQQWRSGRSVRPQPVARLRRWRWAAVAFCAGVVGLALVLPLGVLVYWLAVGLRRIEALGPIGEAALNSVYASSVAALAAVAAALPVALLMVRYPSLLSALVERAAYAGFALPGIVVALALVFFGARYATPVYQTIFLLVFAYVVRFLPQALGAARASLLQVSPRLEEAARSLGRTWPRVLIEVTLPLVRPGVVAGAALVFLTSMKELPATLLLSPIGFKTLATVSWRNATEGFFAEAALPALLLVLVSGLSLSFVLGRGESGEGRHE
ncbi:MAG: iron ABC transporter permease [Chloroflexi bacterium]|nr:iron ABC transporter permease [Chloroflexota bacterium]